jgi:hypothetical protein
MTQAASFLPQHALNRRQECGTDYQGHRPRVLKQIPIVVLFEQGIEGNGNRTNLQDPEKGVRERRLITEEERHALLWTHAQLAQRAAATIHPLGELAIRDPLVAAFDRD